MKKPDILYLPANSGSLSHYFSRAIILPANFYNNKPRDIQDLFNHVLLLSTEKWIGDSDCSIEIIAESLEKEPLHNMAANFFLYENAIPVSRIKKIHFLSEEQKSITVWNINAGTAFIPERLVEVEKDNNKKIANKIQIPDISFGFPKLDIDEKVKRFDILLGGLALMKIGRKEGLNFSKNYFSTLSYFNSIIREQVQNAEKQMDLEFSDEFIGVFANKNDNVWSKWQTYIFKIVEPKHVEQLAVDEGIKVEKKLGFVQLNSLNPKSKLFSIAVLATYGDKKPKSIDDFIADLIDGKFAEDKLEEICLLLGLNNRYSKFRNAYKLNRKTVDVKFRLETKLDYYTIESIFQFVFNSKKDNASFQFIDDLHIDAPSAIDLNGYRYYTILDVDVKIPKEKSPEKNLPHEFSEDFYEKLKAFLESHLTAELQKYFGREQSYLAKIKDLTNDKHNLTKQLDALNAKVVLEPGKDKMVQHNDNLDKLEYKELKNIAREKGIKQKEISNFPQTREGFEGLINLIRITNPLI